MLNQMPKEPFTSAAFLQGLILSIVMGGLAYGLKVISLSGMIGGAIFGTLIYASTGWRGFLVPLFFIVIGVLATKHGYAKKLEMGIAQEEGGKRSAKHALANILAGTIFAILSALFQNELVRIFFLTGFTLTLREQN